MPNYRGPACPTLLNLQPLLPRQIGEEKKKKGKKKEMIEPISVYLQLVCGDLLDLVEKHKRKRGKKKGERGWSAIASDNQVTLRCSLSPPAREEKGKEGEGGKRGSGLTTSFCGTGSQTWHLKKGERYSEGKKRRKKKGGEGMATFQVAYSPLSKNSLLNFTVTL